MTTLRFKIDDFESLSRSLNIDQLFPTLEDLKKASNMANYDSLKYALDLITTIADIENIFKESSLNLFKTATTIIQNGFIKPLLEDITICKQQDDQIEIKAKIITKWWVNYLSLLNEVYSLKKNHANWGNDLHNWILKEEIIMLQKTLDVLKGFHHWKILLLRCMRLKEEILVKTFDSNQFDEQYKTIKEYLQRSYVYKELQNAKVSKENNKVLKFRSKILQELLNILEDTEKKNEENLKNSILSGRFDKKTYPQLMHTLIIGDDGGIFALMNSIDENEKSMILDGGQIQEDYAQNWPDVGVRYKVNIGEGSFGKIRLCMAITKNETSETLKPGQLICVKKTAYFQKKFKKTSVTFSEIREHTWNDYSVGDVGRLIFSPAVYDMKIIEPCHGIVKEHQKGYTMQQFVPVYDGSKIFQKNQKYFDNWTHQKSYLISIFEVVSKLLDMGICMTDLKPQNTLYDGENNRGMLIDLAGVVRKLRRKDLETCKVRYIKETNKNYSSPELLKLIELEIDSEVVDLCKCMAYSLGRMIKVIVLETTKNKDLLKDLNELYDALTRKELEGDNARISVEDGMHILRKIGEEKTEFKVDFQPFITTLKQKTDADLGKFGLNPEMKKIEKNFIKLMANNLDPERVEQVKSFDLQQDLDEFLYKSKKEDPTVYVLLGSSGSGKSTVIQKKYIETLNKWTINDPIPLFINLATEVDIKTRWKWLNQEMKLDHEMSFTIFSGAQKYPVILFIDSFDEVPTKINYVTTFLEDLGNNPMNKCLICCRSEFIQKDQDLLRWFGLNTGGNSYASSFLKRYIVPLETKNFDLNLYIENYYEDKTTDISPTLTKKQLLKISKKVFEKNMGLMKTSFMVHLTLEVLPEIITEKNTAIITRRMIYYKFIERKIGKISPEVRKLFKETLKLTNDEQFFKFLNESASSLVRILFKIGTNRLVIGPESIHNEISKELFDHLKYSKGITCLENKILEGFIRGLDLNFEIRGTIPQEQITIGFGHDTIKNYFLVCAIIEECENMNKIPQKSSLLGFKLLVEDEVLIKFLAEVVVEQENFRDNLKRVVLKSKNAKNDEIDIINAAANAITILVASNVSFAGEDLKGIKIKGSNLRDGVFSGCDFTDADLSEVVLDFCKLDYSIFKRTNLENVKFSIYLDLDLQYEIRTVAFSPNGKIFLSASGDGLIRLWETASGRHLITFTGHEDLIVDAKFSHDSEFLMILSGSNDCKVKLWDRITGNLLKTFSGHNGGVNTVSFNDDMSLILSGADDGTGRIWDKNTGNEIFRIDAHNSPLWQFCLSPDQTMILSCGEDSKIKLWDKKNCKLIRSFEGHTRSVYCCIFNHDGKVIISGSSDNTIKLWETATANLIITLKGHNGTVRSLSFSRDETLILSSGSDNKIKIWDKNSGIVLKTFKKHTETVRSAVFSPDETNILSGSIDGTIKLWDISAKDSFKTFDSQQSIVNSVAFSPKTETFLVCSSDNTIKLWETDSGNLIQTYESMTRLVSIAFSKDGNTFFSESTDGNLHLWDKNTGKILRSFTGFRTNGNNDGLSFDENIIILYDSDKRSLSLWDKNTADSLQTLNGHGGELTATGYSNNGNYILSCSEDKTIILWDKQAANLRRKYHERIKKFIPKDIVLENPLYVQKYVIGPKGTSMTCKNLLLFSDVKLSQTTKNLFMSFGAIELNSDIENEILKEGLTIKEEFKEVEILEIKMNTEKENLIVSKPVILNKEKKSKKCLIF